MNTTMYCKRILAVALALLMVATAAILTAPQAEAAMIPESGNTCSIKAYTLQTTGNVRVYTNAACTTGGNEYIAAATDECYIQKINLTYNSIYVSYPTKSGRKSRWVPASAFTSKSGALTGSPVVVTATSKITTYKKNNTRATYGSIAAGDKIYLLETSGSMTRVVYPISGGWYKMAWALTSQLPQPSAPTPSPNAKTGYVKTSGASSKLNVRSVPSTSSSILAKLTYGTQVNILSQTGNWYQISFSGGSGYVYAQYISLSPLAAPAATNSLTNALYKINTTSSYITCGFDGYRNTPGRHEGIDFKRYVNAPVYSLTDGVITKVANGAVGSNGLSTIAIYNSAKNVTVIYLHTKPVSGLYVGQQISTGQQIATESWRGVSSQSGAHTHVELRTGKRTSAAKSVNDKNLDNPNPTSYWNAFGYAVF